MNLSVESNDKFAADAVFDRIKKKPKIIVLSGLSGPSGHQDGMNEASLYLPEKLTQMDFWDKRDCRNNHSDVGLSFWKFKIR